MDYKKLSEQLLKFDVAMGPCDEIKCPDLCASGEDCVIYRSYSAITDLLSRAEDAEERAESLEMSNRLLSTRITEAEARCTSLDEARENANEACAKWEGMYRMALERAEKAEKCIDAIEDDLDRGNDNDWAREHIREYRTAKEE